MFNLTPAAAQQINVATELSEADGMALRIAARTESDGSINYGMGFDDAREGDLQLELHAIPVVIGPDSQPLLESTVLDYVELEPGAFNFIFIDQSSATDTPNPTPTSGCSNGSCGGGSCGGARTSC
jgi:iron-sulfur cluster assembly protein